MFRMSGRHIPRYGARPPVIANKITDNVLRSAWQQGQHSPIPEPPQGSKLSVLITALTKVVHRAYPSTKTRPLVSLDTNREEAEKALKFVENRALEIFTAEVHAKGVSGNANLKVLASPFFRQGTSSLSGHDSFHPLTLPADTMSGDTTQKELDRVLCPAGTTDWNDATDGIPNACDDEKLKEQARHFELMRRYASHVLLSLLLLEAQQGGLQILSDELRAQVR